MWILSQDKQTLINTNYLRQFTLGPNRYSIQSAEFINPNDRSTLGVYTTPEEIKVVGDMIRDRIQAIEAGVDNVKYIFEMPLMVSEIFGEVDYDAVFDDDLDIWYITITDPSGDLDSSKVDKIELISVGNKLILTPTLISPNTNEVLIFNVADENGSIDPSLSGAKYTYKITPKTGDPYLLTFFLDPSLIVIDVEEDDENDDEDDGEE